MRLNPHLHVVALDGVEVVGSDGQPVFRALGRPRTDEVADVVQVTKGRLISGQGSVYPALRELEQEGLVKSYEGEALAERGGRPRRYYRLTAEGRRAANDQRELMGVLSSFPEFA